MSALLERKSKIGAAASADELFRCDTWHSHVFEHHVHLNRRRDSFGEARHARQNFDRAHWIKFLFGPLRLIRDVLIDGAM
jgi:hypothetical protein